MFPALFAGLKLATTSTIAVTTIVPASNAGGLGSVLFDGLRTASLPKLLWGTLLTVALSLLAHLIVYLLEDLFPSSPNHQQSTHRIHQQKELSPPNPSEGTTLFDIFSSYLYFILI